MGYIFTDSQSSMELIELNKGNNPILNQICDIINLMLRMQNTIMRKPDTES